MTYRFPYQVRAVDLWWLSMYNMYRSTAGMCNLIFTVAMVILTVTFWGRSGVPIKAIMIGMCLLFPFVQPIIIYLKARRQMAFMPKDMEIEVGEKGLQVTTSSENQMIPWNQIKQVSDVPRMVILHAGGGQGYMLTNVVLQERKKEFVKFVKSKVTV